MRAIRTMAASLLAAALLLTGCQDGEPPVVAETPTSGPSSTAEPTESESAEPETGGTVVQIIIESDSVEPNGERVEAMLGEPIILRITSDRAGELHVHSTPEQEVSFEKGTSEVRLTIDQPGVAEVEDHHSGLVVVQLQVS